MPQTNTVTSISPELAARLRAMPKVEIHVHVEGATDAETFYQIAQQNHVELPTSSLAEWQSFFEFRDFSHFIQVYAAAVQCLQTPEDYALIIERFYKRQAEENIPYTEAFLSSATSLELVEGEPMERSQTELQTSYDRVAAEYAKRFYDELDRKPFDCKMLDWFIEKVNGVGTICDLGCGSGHAANYLHSRGLGVCGIDLSSGMVEQAQRLNPNITFQQGDMLSLDDSADDSFGGIAAFYSIIHLPRLLVVDALREMNRVLHSKGTLLITFHIGQQTHHLEEWFDRRVFLDFHFFETAQMKVDLQIAGFKLEEAVERDPYPEIEVQTRRAYLFAKKP